MIASCDAIFFSHFIFYKNQGSQEPSSLAQRATNWEATAGTPDWYAFLRTANN